MTLTQKETTLLNDLRSQEQLCIEKYGKYSDAANDPTLKSLFTSLKENEEKQLSQINVKNQDLLKKLYNLKDELKTVKDQNLFDKKMSEINAIDFEIQKDYLTKISTTKATVASAPSKL